MSGPPLDTDVLIVGAGPTGLVLALWLSRMGVRVRVIDRTVEPGTTSRALVVHARTLEQYDQLGLAGALVERGLKVAAANLWVAGRKVARAPFGDLGSGISPFPYALVFPQDEHERLLIQHLLASGVEVKRRAELTRFDDGNDRIRAILRHDDGTEEPCTAAYLAGCDGAHSRVRELLNTGFPGGTYAHLFYVADVEARGPVMDRELHIALDAADFLGVFPLRDPGHARLVGTVRPAPTEGQQEPAWDDVSRSIVERMRISVERVNWFSSYHVHHRVAGEFREGRAFLLGDAAHIHSPVGGQGMNTGIGDAINLAWKLAGVLRCAADPQLLDSYEPERIGFAQRLVATTDRAFTFVTRDGSIARFMRLHVVPGVISTAFALPAFRRLMFRTVSQTAINYRNGPLAEGAAGDVQGGDRLPWVVLDPAGGTSRDNFEPLTALDWQVHVYGVPSSELVGFCEQRQLSLHRFDWCPAMERAGLARDALYLVRPDGYVALADRSAGTRRLLAYLDARRLRPFAATRAPVT